MHSRILALDTLKTAELALRNIISDAIKAGSYEDVPPLTDIARRVAQIAASIQTDEVVLDKPGPTYPISNRAALKSTTKATYPMFVVDGSRLIKIGWSKKERAPYEHKVSKEDVQHICLAISDQASSGAFRMEDVLPIESPEGGSLPSYQAYLTVAWLRARGLLNKSGNEGYRWISEPMTPDTFESAWRATTSKS